MKKIILLLFLIPVFVKGQDNSLITNLQLKGGTVKILSAIIYGNPDTSLGNTFHKWREDYIDGSTPNDNANVTISTTKTENVVTMYELLLNLPGGYLATTNYLNDFKTSIQSKRNGNPVLDAACTKLETRMDTSLTQNYSEKGLGYLQSK